MTTETMSVSTTIEAPADAVFGILSDPSTHQAIDGTGWVREPRDAAPLTQVGQIFRMGMYHSNHPNGDYEMSNRVHALERPRVISWEPGGDLAGDGDLTFGGWIWRYDLTPLSPDTTRVELSYDWSAVPAELRQDIQFPPFDSSHLDNSLEHLAALAVSARDEARD